MQLNVVGWRNDRCWQRPSFDDLKPDVCLRCTAGIRNHDVYGGNGRNAEIACRHTNTRFAVLPVRIARQLSAGLLEKATAHEVVVLDAGEASAKWPALCALPGSSALHRQ